MALIGPSKISGRTVRASRRGPRYSYMSINPGLYRQRPKPRIRTAGQKRTLSPRFTGRGITTFRVRPPTPPLTPPDYSKQVQYPGLTPEESFEVEDMMRRYNIRTTFGGAPPGYVENPFEKGGGFTITPAGGGGGGGILPPPPSEEYGYQPIDVEWVIGNYAVSDKAPSWWRPFDIKDKSQYNRPDVAFTLMANALIGSGALSDEDARALAKQLYAMWGRAGENPWDIYSDKFADENRPPGRRIGAQGQPAISRQLALIGQTAPGGVIDERSIYSRERANRILQALSRMREATVGGNVWKFGPGYQYLQNIAGALGTAGPVARTRAQRLEVLGALDPLLAQAKSGELSAFAPLAQMIAQPFYTYAPPRVSRTQEGRYQFGRRSKYLTF